MRTHATAVPAGYHSPQLDVPVRLNTNEAPEGPPPSWLDEYLAAVRALDWNRYPDRAAVALRSAIAGLHGVERLQVFAANGSNEVLQAILLAFGGPGRVAATFEPSYLLHQHIARTTRTEVVSGERAERFELSADEVTRVVSASSPDVTFLCSPNNPTGNVMDRAVLDAALTGDGLVVVDEAYAQFASWSSIDFVGEERSLVVVRTFSKTWALAGLRLGYAVAPAWVVDRLEAVTLPYHLDAAKQLAGTLALRHVDEMNARVAAITSERERVQAALAEPDLEVDAFPSEANFVLFRPRRRRGADVWSALVERGVLVRDCSSWPRLAGCLRVTIGTPYENDTFLDALRSVLTAVSA